MRAPPRPPSRPATSRRPGRTIARSSRSRKAQTMPGPRSPTRARTSRSPEARPGGTRKTMVRALLWLILAGLAAAPAQAERLELTGQTGVLGEWELTATVAEAAPGGGKEFAGPLTLTHVGMCTQDGPEQKSGE